MHRFFSKQRFLSSGVNLPSLSLSEIADVMEFEEEDLLLLDLLVLLVLDCELLLELLVDLLLLDLLVVWVVVVF